MGAIKQILFYKSFNFNVIEYIELSEVLILFLNDIFYLILMIIMSVIFWFFQTSKYKLNKIENIQKEIKQSENFGKRIKNYYRLYKEGLWAIFFLGILDLVIYIISKTTNENIHLLLIISVAICFTMIIWIEIKLKIKRLSGDNISTSMNNLIVVFIVISAFFSNNIFK
jgi:TRAP-type C4-dicarboxylate transport system permease large subunit